MAGKKQKLKVTDRIDTVGRQRFYVFFEMSSMRQRKEGKRFLQRALTPLPMYSVLQAPRSWLSSLQ